MGTSRDYLVPEVWLRDVLVFKDEGYHLHHNLYNDDGHVFQKDRGEHTASVGPHPDPEKKDKIYIIYIMPLGGGQVKVTHGRAYGIGSEAWKDVLRWVLQGLA